MRQVVRLLLVLAAAFVLVVGLAQLTPATAHRHGGEQRLEDCDGHRDGDGHGGDDSNGGGDCQTGTTIGTTAPAAPSGTGSTAPASASVSIPAHSFSPASVTIAVGGTVRWTNGDRDSHTVTADNGSFDSGILAPGGTFSHTFPTAGTFAYHCEIHPDMRGTVTVTGAGSATRPTAAAAAPTTGTARSTPSAPAAAPASGRSVDRPVRIIDFAFSPQAVAAVVGDTVTWTNQGSAVHTATADNGSFDSGLVKPGGKWRFALTKAGTFRYHCTVHPNMVGTIKVAPAGSSAPAVAAAAKRSGAVVTKAAAPVAPAAGPAGGQGTTAGGDDGAKAAARDASSAAGRLNPALVAALLVAVAGSAGLLATAVAVLVATRKLFAAQPIGETARDGHEGEGTPP